MERTLRHGETRSRACLTLRENFVSSSWLVNTSVLKWMNENLTTEMILRRNPGCPMMRKQATVMVISSERNAQEACIDNEKVYAEFINDFTDIKFYDLPNKAVNPCSPRPGQMPASGPPPASADDTNILKITGILHI
ncbi:hypothetical protein J6590_059661 [Homalodisca vitripennis]|nr:hypothetical protein J6590_059661 [Homalodisca vitripennis]